MNITEVLLISVGLAMDAFAVAICKSMAMKKLEWKKAILIGLYFGAFQAIMPVFGYLLGSAFYEMVTKVDHWIALFLLGAIGVNMIKEAFDEESDCDDKVDVKTMVTLAVATSIDALACGITLACLNINIIFPVISIGVITFGLSVIGVIIGYKFGEKLKTKAQILGGIILILLGVKILLEHLEIIQF